MRDGIRNSLNALNVDLLFEKAEIKSVDKKIVVSCGENEFTAKDLIIATGSKTILPEIQGIEEEIKNSFLCTNNELFCLEELPKSIVIIGGGISGVEMAYAFKSFGSDVTVIEARERIVGGFDLSFSIDVQKNLEAKGVKFVLNGVVMDVCEGVVYVKAQGEEFVCECDIVYLSTGREMTNSEMFSEFFEVIGGRFIKVDEKFQTNFGHVYAIGDVNGRSMLAHSAINQAQIVVNEICGIKNQDCPSIVPQVIYISPECMQVGENVESATAKGLKFETISVSMNYSGRYVTSVGKLSSEGKIRVLIDERERIIGACMTSNYSSEIAMTLNFIISMQMSCDEIMKYIFPHPTEGEIIRKCISLYKQK